MGDAIRYHLPETVVRVSGTVTTTVDEFGSPEGDDDVGAVSVVVDVRADEGNGRRLLNLDGALSDDEYTLELTDDGRLVSVSYNGAGVGARLVSAAGTLVAFVGGLVLRKGAVPAPAAAVLEGMDRQPTEPTDPCGALETPEERARCTWEAAHPELVALLAAHRKVVVDVSGALPQRLAAVVASGSGAGQRAQLASVDLLQQARERAQAEIARIEALYAAWRAGTKTSRSAVHHHALSIDVLRVNKVETPNPGSLAEGDPRRRLWEQLGVYVQIAPVEGRLEVRRPEPPGGSAAAASDRISWRVPRPNRLVVWKRDEDGTPVLEQSLLVEVVDRHSEVDALRIEKRAFGSSGGSISFGPNGMPTKLGRKEQGMLGALADALAGVPGTVAAGLEQAGKVRTSLAQLPGIEEAERLASLKRQVEAKQQDLLLAGLDATAGQHAELERLKQQVAIAEQESTLSPGPPGAQALLEAELARLRTELAIERARRQLETLGDD